MPDALTSRRRTRRSVGAALLVLAGLAGLLASVAGLAGCGYPPEGPAPTPLTAEQAHALVGRSRLASEAALRDGETTFAARCNGCHHYPDRNAFSATQWPEILQRMGKKARLTAAQEQDVLDYVLATRSGP